MRMMISCSYFPNVVKQSVIYMKINQQGIVVLFFLAAAVHATSVQMRIVRETASYGYFGNSIVENENNQALAVSPANFSGPSLLRRLIGKCYNFTQDQYRYKFCPFQNFSQYELSSRWNAYHGVLGVWSHWQIKNNTFNSMVYKHGDRCGDIERYVQVYLQCGAAEILANVSEPNKCYYEAIFQTRYVCHNDSLLVYPRLTKDLQRRWDRLFTELNNGDIAEKGYYSSLEQLFQSAGFLEKEVSRFPNKVTTVASNQLESVFADLNTCNKEYKNIARENAHLNQEIDALKLMLDLRKMENRTSKPHL